MHAELDRTIAATQAAEEDAPSREPGFHHIKLNVVDPDRTARFFTAAFPTTELTQLAGQKALRTQDVLIQLNQVDTPAPHGWNTALWHIGWHSADVLAEYERLIALGIEFFRVPPPTGHFVSPDKLGVEISPGRSLRFDHVHLMSDAPLAAADWYVSVLGLRRGPMIGGDDVKKQAPFAERSHPGNQYHRPSVRLYAGDILLFVYPNQDLDPFTANPVESHTHLESSKGHVLEHLAFYVPDVEAEEDRLRGLGVPILEGVRPFDDAGHRILIIEGPDSARLALVDGPR
jgi:catechol 2,3-dioxygenase-like lactoylglutathione lyase family enzyme